LVDIAIQQLNLGYHADQDRLLLRVGLSNNTELLVWITLRIAKQIWQLLNGETQLPNNKQIAPELAPTQAVEQFHQEVNAANTLQSMDFATEYQPRKAAVSQGAVLATQVSFSRPHNQAVLDMSTLEGVNVRLNLNQTLTLAICNMLQLGAKEAAWDIGAGAVVNASVVMVDKDSKQVLH
jgi:hypothetical protein